MEAGSLDLGVHGRHQRYIAFSEAFGMIPHMSVRKGA